MMKAPLIFKQKFKPNRILASFILNLRLFSFFSITYKHDQAIYCAPRFSFANVDFEKKSFMCIYLCKYLEIKVFWSHLLQLFTAVVMLR